jgi:abortive infection bacteriophage resistance protein
MTDKFSKDPISEVISSARLAPYHLAGESFEQAYKRYMWNVRLSEAMLPSISYLEIIFRNKLDKLIQQHFGKDWLTNPPSVLCISEANKDKIIDGVEKFKREYKRPASHDDILAQISFGFWCAFFHRRYDPVLWQKKHAITDIFNNMPRKNRTRRNIEQSLFLIKNLRNRIAHHEPIWNMKPSVVSIHAECHLLIGAMSPTALDTLKTIDRFPEIWRETKEFSSV